MGTYRDNNLNKIIINKLSQAQYDELEEQSQISEDELYIDKDAKLLGAKGLVYKNVVANNFVADATYEGYEYSCTITCEGMTADKIVEVIFGLAEATSGNYAPICESGNGSVKIYSKVNDSITIPVIKEMI